MGDKSKLAQINSTTGLRFNRIEQRMTWMEGKPEFRSQKGNPKNAKPTLCGSVLISQTLATPQGGAQVSQIRKPNQSRLRCPVLYAVAAFPKWVREKMPPFPLFSTGFSAVHTGYPLKSFTRS
jgi:hypothetical protein